MAKKAKKRAFTKLTPPPIVRAPRARRSDFIPPEGAVGAVFITPTICEFQYRDGSQFTLKQVTPSMLKLAFSEEPVDSGWLSPGSVRWGSTSYGVYTVGYFAPAIYRFGIEFDKGIKRLRAPMPALVFAGIRDKYHVWAMKERVFTPKAQLYYAPLPNLNEHGHICFGNNRHPDVRTGGFAPYVADVLGITV